MKILMFSINPLYKSYVTGGASKHIKNISAFLGQSGHEVTILCTRSETNADPFVWSENVLVKPILPYKQPFPSPYSITAGDLAFICETVNFHLDGSDKFYIHDGEFLLPFLHEKIPTIISYRDNVYPESILGSFISNGDQIIAVSRYSSDVIKFTAGRLFPELEDRITIIPNGIDFDRFKPTRTQEIAKKLGVDISKDVVILHPHRPEIGKGLIQTIRVVELLLRKYKLSNVKVLVPEWISEMASPEDRSFYKQIESHLDQTGLRDHFIFHSWLSQELMPAYYSLGNLTLCLGSFVEAFGNVAYESLACGTPSIVARVGVHRTMLPDELTHKVDYDDIDTAAEIAYQIIKTHQKMSKDEIDNIKPYFSLEKQCKGYLHIIENCKKEKKMDCLPIKLDINTTYKLAPWCSIGNKGIYHDFRNKYYDDPLLLKTFKTQGQYIKNIDLAILGGGETVISNWYQETIIVPVL